MTDKEVARFKVKFPKINLSKARLDATKLSLADDADDAAIDARLDELNGNFSFEDMAKYEDWQRQKAKADPAPQPKQADPAPTNVPDDKDTPTWAKTLIEQNTKLNDRIAAIESGKVGETRRQQLEKALEAAPDNFKKVTLKNFDRMQFGKDEDFTTYLEEVKTDAGEFKQSEANSSMAGFKAPAQAKADTSKQASKEELDAAMSNLPI